MSTRRLPAMMMSGSSASASARELLHTSPTHLASQNFFLHLSKPPPGPKPGEEWWRWAEEHGGRDAYASHVLVILQATLDRTVLVRAPRVSRALSTATGIVCGPEGQGGNGLLVRRYYIDLDDARPVARYMDQASKAEMVPCSGWRKVIPKPSW